MNTNPVQFYDLLARAFRGDTSSKRLQGFLDKTLAEKYNVLQIPGFEFEPDMQLDFTYEQVQKELGITAMANYYDLDSKPIPRGAEGVSLLTGKIPRMKDVIYFNEDKVRKQLITEKLFGETSDEAVRSAKRKLFETLDDLIGGHTNSLTYQRHQMISAGKLTLTDTNNPKGIKNVTFSASVPSANKKIRFFLDRHAIDSRARWRNQDGIDLRVGCHDFVIEDIYGETGDDLIALTALGGEFGHGSANPSKSCDIWNVRIRRVRGRTNMCALVRLLAHYGHKVHDISIEDVVEDSFPGVHDHSQMAIRIGDRLAGYYGNDEKNGQKPGDMYNITVDGLVTRALSAVQTADSVRNLTVRNVRLFGDAQSVWTAGSFLHATPVFIYSPEREDEIRNDWLTPIPTPATAYLENVLLENITVESRKPARDFALFRFRKTECVNCTVRNLKAPEGRKLVETIETSSLPKFE